MQIRSRYLYLSLFVIHSLIAAVAFKNFRISPDKVLFASAHDGLKNYFTLRTFVSEPVGKDGIFKYNTFNYPYGEYVFCTDNTPLFSVPYRWFCQNVYDISAHVIPVFNLIVILNIILCGLLVFYAFSYLLRERLFAFMLAIVLPWINFQVLRIWQGHFNLSFSSLILLAICLMILWHKYRGQLKKQAAVALGMCLLSYSSFLMHGYYLAIITPFLGAMLVAYSIFHLKERHGKAGLIAACVVPLTTLVLSYGTLYLTDDYLALRQENARGYDWMEQKTRVSALFSHYSFHTVFFPVQNLYDNDSAERAAYLGNIGLYAAFILLLICILHKRSRKEVTGIQKDFFRDPLKTAILSGSTLMLIISFGEKYYIGDQNGYLVHNLLNPFLYLHKLTPKIEQFRSLERFAWPFFFGFYIWVMFTVAVLFYRSSRRIRAAILFLFILLGGWEVKDFVDVLQAHAANENHLSRKHTSQLSMNIDFTRYQAILPLPYYMVGSENYDYTIDDIADWSRFTYQLSLRSHLPLMATKLSRTVPEHSIEFLNLIGHDSISPGIRERLNEKPILVAVHQNYIRDSSLSSIPRLEPALTDYWLGNTFAERNNLRLVDSSGEVRYYEWYPQMK